MNPCWTFDLPGWKAHWQIERCGDFPFGKRGSEQLAHLSKVTDFPQAGTVPSCISPVPIAPFRLKGPGRTGGRIFKAKFSVGKNGFVSLVTDTEGNMIGLHSLQ